MGVMALLIAILSCGQAEPAKRQDIAKYQSLINEIALVSKKLDQITSPIDHDSNPVPDEILGMKKLEENYAGLLQRIQLQTYKEDLLEKEAFWSKVKELETLEQVLAKNKDKVASIQSRPGKALESQKQFTIFPSSGSGGNVEPVFIECRSEGIVIHNRPGTESLMVTQDQIRESKEYHKILRQIKKSSDSTAIFIIRPGAVQAYYKAHSLAKNWDVKSGKIPAPSGGEINFGMLTAAIK